LRCLLAHEIRAEHLLDDGIAEAQHAVVVAADEAREVQELLGRRRRVLDDLLGAGEPTEDRDGLAGAQGSCSQEPPDVMQQRFLARHARGEEELVQGGVDILVPAATPHDGARKLLCQIRLPARPHVNSREQ
jgi:hypothetical protein